MCPDDAEYGAPFHLDTHVFSCILVVIGHL